MSCGGNQGRDFGPRGARSNGLSAGSSGPPYQRSNFNRERHSWHRSTRLPGAKHWRERSPHKIRPWQAKTNFSKQQFRGNLRFPQNDRQRGANDRGVVRYPGSGRIPGPPFSMGVRNSFRPRPSLQQEERIQDKRPPLPQPCTLPQPPLLPQTALPGSEEERQQKISETADKLKLKLSSITVEEMTNFWDDDSPVLPETNAEKNIHNRGIPELRHEPPELNLTFTDFRDIGRVDYSDSKLDDVQNVIDTSDVTIIFEKDATNNFESTNEIVTLPDDISETLHPSDPINDNEVFNVSATSSESCQEQLEHKQSDSVCNTEKTGTDCRNNIDNIHPPCENDMVQTDVNINVPHLNCAQPIENADTEISTSINNLQQTKKQQDQNLMEAGDIQSTDFIELKEDISQMDKMQTDGQIPQSLHTSHYNSTTEQLSSEVTTHLPNTSSDDQLNSYDQHPQDHSNIYEQNLQDHLNYDQTYVLGENRKSCNPHDYQVPLFNDRPRFGRRMLGPMIRPRRPFHQSGKSLFMQGPQRLPINQNRRPLLRHPIPCLQSNLPPPIFDSWALPQFNHNVASTNHETQGHGLLPYPLNKFPPNFDPTEPPPNLRTIPLPEISPGNDVLQNVPPLDRNIQFPMAFDPREPPIRVTNLHPLNDSLSAFNHQQLQQNLSNQEDSLQRPVQFDPTLSHQQHPNVMRKSPLVTSGSNALMNLVETSRVSDFSMGAYPQMQSMNIPPAHQSFISPVHTSFHHGFPHSNIAKVMTVDCPAPLSLPMNLTDLPPVAPPLPEDPSNKPKSFTDQQNTTMDDGLEDMQEAMEFAKNIMNMTDEADKNKNDCPPEIPELPVTETVPVAVPKEETNTLNISLPNEVQIDALDTTVLINNTATNDKQNTTCVSKSKPEKQKTSADTSLEKNHEENLSLIDDQIRPKVVFNLNSKSKRISKAEEWCMQNEQTWQKKPKSLPIVRSKESPSYVSKCKHNEGEIRVKKDSELKNYSDKNSSQRKMTISKKEFAEPSTTSISQNSNDNGCVSHVDKARLLSPNTIKSSSRIGQKLKKSKIQIKKLALPASESSWKSRVINRFLKMSKNDICNMVNNSSLRKFDIAMKHLVKEKRSSLSLEIRNTENEKMKEYDRDEFMNQLNAMLDPGAVVDISNLPTEFIHHLSEVLQLDPMPFDSDISSLQEVANNQLEKTSQPCNSSDQTVESIPQENILSEHSNTEIETQTTDQITANVNKSNLDKTLSPITTAPEHISEHVTKESTDNDKLNICEKSRSTEKHIHHEPHIIHKKHQPLFNVADLDDILSDVGKCTSRSNPRQESKKSSTEERKLSTSNKLKLDNSVCKVKNSMSNRDASPRLPNQSKTDLDDIFSSGIARAKLANQRREAEYFRSRKSTSEDRSTFRIEKYERWNRKEREEPDAFRNLTKEEWEAKYGKLANTDEPSSTFKHRSSCQYNDCSSKKEYRNYRSQRHSLSDSPTRNLSMSPIARENIVNDTGRHSRQSGNYTEDSRKEESNSDGDSSSTSSSSDSYDEVAPDVTKLLKVIKQSEKIGKKKSLNETIRDEVTAEIERKWKEKDKCRERRSYKRDKGRKEGKWKCRKERMKWKSRSEERSRRNSEETLLTEDQIKKEVIIKQEMETEKFGDLQDSNEQMITNASSLLDNITTESSRADHLSQTVEEFVTPTTCNSIQKEVDDKVSIVLTKIQSKTKAQLKQISESPNVDQDQVGEGLIQSQKFSVDTTSTDLLTRKENVDKAEITSENTNERGLQMMSTHNNSLNETNKSLIVANVPSTEASSYTIKCKNMESLASDTVSSTTDIATSNQQKEKEIDVATSKSLSCAEKPIITDNLSISTKNLIRSIENRTGSKRIDIKAYKERALLKRLKENDRSKETTENSVSSTQDLFHAPATNNKLTMPGNVASPIDVNQTKAAESSGNYGQNKEVQLNNDLISVSCYEDCGERLMQIDQSILHARKEALFSASSRNDNEVLRSQNKEKNVDSISNSDTSSKSPNVEPSHTRNVMRSTSFEKFTTPKQDENKCQEQENTTSSTGNSIGKKKFENIKSEGHKELKLKKEKEKGMSDRKKSVEVSRTKPSNVTSRKDHLETESTNANRDISTEKIKTPEQRQTINENMSSENSGFMIRDACNIKRSKTENNRVADQIKNTSTLEVKHPEPNSVQEPPSTMDNQVSSSPQERHTKNGNEINVKKSTELFTSTSSKKLNAVKQFSSSTETYANWKLTLNETVQAEDTLQQNTMNTNNKDKYKDSSESACDTDKLKNVAKDKIVTPDSPETPLKGISREFAEVHNNNSSALLNTDKSNKDEIRVKCREPIVISTKEFTSDKRQVNINEPSSEINRLEIKLTSPVNQATNKVLQSTENSIVDRNFTLRDITKIEEPPKPEEALAGDDYLNINITGERKSLIIDQIHQYSTDDENEPFIVLDEYIDDTDGRSNGRLSISEPELEDCIARDADAYLNKNTQQKDINLLPDLKSTDFHAINFTVLSEVSYKEKEVVHKQKSDKPKNKDNEEMSITNANAQLTNTTILQPKKQDRVKDTFTDVPQVSVASNSMHNEKKKIVHATPQCSREPSEVKQKSEIVKSGRLETGRNIMHTTKKLNVPTKAALKESVENVFRPSFDVPKVNTNTEKSTEGKSKIHINHHSHRDKDKEQEVTNNSKSKTNNTVQKAFTSGSSNVKKSSSSNTHPSGPVAAEKVKEPADVTGKKHKHTGEVDGKTESFDSSNRSDKRQDHRALHKTKNKQRMKHKKEKERSISEKKIKDAVKSDIVKLGEPKSKETIVARMIEIDVEIHKLMTEKMELYQILEKDKLPEGNALNQKDTLTGNKQAEITPLRPHTPSALMSKLIQNIDVIPAVGVQTTPKGIMDSTKTNNSETVQSEKHKAPSKLEQNTRKRNILYSSSDENGENRHYIERRKSQDLRRRNKNKIDRTVRWQNSCAPSSSIPSTSSSRKQFTDKSKSILKKTHMEVNQELIEVDVSHDSLEGHSHSKIAKTDSSFPDKKADKNVDDDDDVRNKSHQPVDSNANIHSNKHSSHKNLAKIKSKTNEKNIDSAASPAITESDKSQQKVESETINCRIDINNKKVKGSLNEENASLSRKEAENKTLERPIIYSDDSTWDSCLQNPASDTSDHRKLNTGLALLEETYKKEMANSRRLKTASRKNKRKQLQNLLNITDAITPDEEELPLSRLYIKKLQQKKDLLDSMCPDAESSSTCDDPKLWENVNEVINAVAEDRIQDLYVDHSKEQLEDSRTAIVSVFDVPFTMVKNKDKKYEDPETSDNSTSPEEEKYSEHDTATIKVKHDDHTNPSAECKENSNIVNENVSNSNILTNDIAKYNVSSTAVTDESQATKVIDNQSVTNETAVQDSSSFSIQETANQINEVCSSSVMNNNNNTLIVEPACGNPPINKHKQEILKGKLDGMTDIDRKNLSLHDAKNTSRKSSDMSKAEHDQNLKQVKGSERARKESEQSTEISSEDYAIENGDKLKSKHSSRKSFKRHRATSKNYHRRSKHAEENVKKTKFELDSSIRIDAYDVEKERPPSANPCKSPPSLMQYNEESKNVASLSTRKSNDSVKIESNRKRVAQSECETSSIYQGTVNNALSTNTGLFKHSVKNVTKKHKANTLLEIKKCEVRLVDSKYSILKPDVEPNMLRRFGISRVNQVSSTRNSSPLISDGDASNSSTKEAASSEAGSDYMFNSTGNEDIIEITSEPNNFLNSNNVQQQQQINSPTTSMQEFISLKQNSDVEDIPVLEKEQITDGVMQISDKSDVEVVEHQSQHQHNAELIMSVIEQDDKELPRTHYTVHKGPILDIKVFGKSFLAASEDGTIYRYSQASNGILNFYKGHRAAVTCLYVYSTSFKTPAKEWLFSGSLDGTLRCYNITTGLQMRDTADVSSPIQCMDQAWGIIYIGTNSGHVSRYHIKSGTIKGDSIQFSEKSVLALKATNEGPRRVLIVASRNQPITIRDAQNGLFLRTICGHRNHTVYSLMRNNNLIYCGTSSTSIPVFDFTNGEQTMQYDAGVGIVCMRLYYHFLFAGCYDGNIYVFDTRDHRLICSIPGPGNMLLSMEVVGDKIIAGSKDKRLQSWQMPKQVGESLS